ncbi:MAG: tRNA (cytidine(34)-2'-O)-methyltransferase [Mycoplasmatota bacterium]|nr:tRNA (cytidine(34)-2'-O)-methyltransferase [Mycoplasmatota bacterium]
MINVVLFEPEIPENTGNIMRTCAGTLVHLHLIRPLGFALNDGIIRRSAVNYMDKVKYTLYDDFDDFCSKNPGEYYFFTRYGKKPHTEIDFSDRSKNIYLIFGKESTGIPKEILRNYLDKCIRIPCSENIRCLNVSNCVAIAVYEVLRQQDYPGLSRVETFKGEDYLLED